MSNETKKLNSQTVTLDQLQRGQKAWVSEFNTTDRSMRRLMELGLLENTPIQILHEAPFGGDPIAVKVRGSLIALRRREARGVKVRMTPDYEGASETISVAELQPEEG